MTPSADGGRIFIAQTNTVRELNFAAGTPPGAPTITSATPGDTYAALAWTAPTSSGSTTITGYRITASNGHAVVYNSTATQQAFPGLTDGTPYTFTVAAENSAGFGPESAPFGPVTPAAPAAAVYHPLTPIRILDTRQSTAFGPSTVRSLKVASANGIPANATSVVVNLAVTNTTANGYFTAYPHGINRPTVSNLNFTAGQTIAVLAQVEVGAFGQIDLYNFAGNADLVVDVAGYFAPPSGAAGLYNPLPPARILDTRPSTKVGLPTTFGPNQVQTLQVTGAGGVPAGASAVVLNVTVGGPTASSYLTLWPSDASRPLASNLNFVAGQVIPNRVYVKLSATGQVSVYNFAGNVDVVVDVAGYFTDGTTLTTGSSYYGRLPQRVIDTRPATQVGPYSSPLGPGGVDVVTGPAGAAAVVASVAVTDTTASSYMTLYPADQSRPTTSDLNWTPGVTIANLTVPKLSASNTFDVYNQQGSVDFVVDVNGYYGP
jgi:hypothetical protein